MFPFPSPPKQWHCKRQESSLGWQNLPRIVVPHFACFVTIVFVGYFACWNSSNPCINGNKRVQQKRQLQEQVKQQQGLTVEIFYLKNTKMENQIWANKDAKGSQTWENPETYRLYSKQPPSQSYSTEQEATLEDSTLDLSLRQQLLFREYPIYKTFAEILEQNNLLSSSKIEGTRCDLTLLGRDMHKYQKQCYQMYKRFNFSSRTFPIIRIKDSQGAIFGQISGSVKNKYQYRRWFENVFEIKKQTLVESSKDSITGTQRQRFELMGQFDEQGYQKNIQLHSELKKQYEVQKLREQDFQSLLWRFQTKNEKVSIQKMFKVSSEQNLDLQKKINLDKNLVREDFSTVSTGPSTQEGEKLNPSVKEVEQKLSSKDQQLEQINVQNQNQIFHKQNQVDVQLNKKNKNNQNQKAQQHQNTDNSKVFQQKQEHVQEEPHSGIHIIQQGQNKISTNSPGESNGPGNFLTQNDQKIKDAKSDENGDLVQKINNLVTERTDSENIRTVPSDTPLLETIGVGLLKSSLLLTILYGFCSSLFPDSTLIQSINNLADKVWGYFADSFKRPQNVNNLQSRDTALFSQEDDLMGERQSE